MAIINLESNTFKDTIKEGITLVDFYADWCGPCKMIAPFVEQVSEEVSDVKVAKINIDNAQDIAQEFGVMSIPTLIVFKDGEVVEQKMGFMPKEQIIALIEAAK